ncbi:MAG: substrate-binding domain-containing protein [Candidatus Bathyarchaeota archaeon]|nr:substrate-binding domain-containing protein [Candidatus Termiticorpusculum sp.]
MNGANNKKIGLIIPDWTNPFFSSIAHSFQNECVEHKYSIIAVDSYNSRARELNNIELLTSMDIDGLIFITVGENGRAYEKLDEFKKPLLVLDREIPLDNVDYLMNNNKLGIEIGLDYLYNLNHRKIAFIAGPQDTVPGKERYDFFCRKMSDLGIEKNDALVYPGDFMFGSGNEAVNQFLQIAEGERPTAIFASNDIMAFGVIQGLHEKGYKIPDDFSILGFDDVQFSSWIYPKLSTIKQDVKGIAKKGVELLSNRIANPNPITDSKIEIINPQLIKRNSCKKIGL